MNEHCNHYGLEPFSIEEFDAENMKGQSEYRKMLRRLCPSKEMRKQARRISYGKHPCDKCAYYDVEKIKCRNPHWNMYNTFIDIDHCYEGILRHLVQEAAETEEKQREAEIAAKDEMLSQMSEASDLSWSIAINNMGITRTFARWIIMMADGNWKMPLAAVKCVRETLDWLNEVLPPDSGGGCEGDGEL